MATKPKAGGGRNASPTVRHTFDAGTWMCPRCKRTIKVLVKVTEPPVCWNHKGVHPTAMEVAK